MILLNLYISNFDMSVAKPIFWTILFLVLIDQALVWVATYPDSPRDSEINAVQRYFSYGRSIESKVRWLVGSDPQQAHGLALTGWLDKKTPRDHAENEGTLVAIYGMSFSGNVGNSLARQYSSISVRLKGGPAAPVNRSYAEYMIDREFHNAPVVVLGIIASSVPAVTSIAHMTWNFEAPGGHHYPRFYIEGGGLRRVDPTVDSLEEFRDALNSDTKWAQLVQNLEQHDALYDSFLFNSDLLDHSGFGRLIRRSMAQSRHRENVSRFYDGKGFTNYLDSVDIHRNLAIQFAKDVRSEGALPVVLLFNDQGFSNHLYLAMADALESGDVPFVSTHEIAPADNFSNFDSTGHFIPELDDAIARELALLIESHGIPIQ